MSNGTEVPKSGGPLDLVCVLCACGLCGLRGCVGAEKHRHLHDMYTMTEEKRGSWGTISFPRASVSRDAYGAQAHTNRVGKV